MNHELDNLETFSRFLLGELPPEEEERMEIRLLEDAELQNLVGAAEFDLMDEYLRGGLSVADATRFETYFLNSPARRRNLELARIFPGPNTQPNLRNDPRESEENAPDNVIAFAPRRKPFAPSFPKAIRQPAFRIAAGLLCTLGLGIVLWQVVWPAWQTREGMAALNEAYRKGRPIEARLSGFDHAPWEKDRGPGDERTDPLLRDRGSLTLLDVASAHPNAKIYRALGSSYLLKREIKLAIEQFEKSLQYEPNNALTHNDLGAALMESAQSKQHQLDREKDKTTPGAEQLSSDIFSDLSLANEHFSQALQVDATLKDAVFNQALCLERLGLLDPALRNWEKYLELDPDGGWREEAQERIEALRKQKQKVTFDKDRIFLEFLAACESGVEDDIWQAFLTGSQMRGNLITDRLLDEYLALLSQGNHVEARKKLNLLTTAGRVEAEKSDDFYTRDLAAFYQSIRPQQVTLLSTARRTFKEALLRNKTSKQEGLALCQQAIERFAQAENRLEMASAILTAGAIHTRKSDYQAARQIAERTIKYANEKRYQQLNVRSSFLMADLSYNQNTLAKAIMYSRRSLNFAEHRKDKNVQAEILGQLAYAYWFIGFHDQSLNYSLQAQRISCTHPVEPETLWATYIYSADALNAVSRLFTSLTFEKEALQLAFFMKRPLQISRSYGYLSDTFEKLKNFDEAIAFARKDLEISNKHSGDPMGEDIKAHALLRLGHLFRESGNLNESIQAYDECVRISKSRGIIHERLDAYRGRLLVYIKNRNYSLAQTELEQAVEIFEQNRNQVDEDDLRSRFFETGHDIYDLGIEISVTSKSDYLLAFRYSELGRARSLSEMLQAADRQLPSKADHSTLLPFSISSQLMDRIPASAQIIQYSFFNQSLYIWLVSNSGFFGIRQIIQEENLNSKVAEYLECIQDPARDERTVKLAKEIYDILIKPIQTRLDPSKEIFIVADKPFHQLPFSALIDSASGKYLMEKYVISFSPSTTVFLYCTNAAARREQATNERFLSVGESVFRQSGLQNASLPSTKKEVEMVALHYGANAKLMLDNAATEPAVREEMKKSEVIHIATHGLINERRPDYSALAFWEEAGFAPANADGMLHAGEISQMKLPAARLVVLSACQSLIGKQYRGEGAMGLARAFLAAGAPLVVASLWKVDSRMTAALMDRFHARRTRPGATTANAFRETQIEMLKSDSASHRRPSAWAGFTPVGGYARY